MTIRSAFTAILSGLMLITSPVISLSKEKDITENKLSYFQERKLEMLNSIIQKNLPRDVDFDHMDMFLIGLRGAAITGFRIEENKDFLLGREKEIPYYFYSAEKVTTKVNPLGLLIGRINVSRMHVDKPTIQLVIDKEGNSNIDDLTEVQDSKILKWLHIKKLQIRNGIINIRDEITMTGRPALLTLNNLEMDIENFAIGKIFSLNLKTSTPKSTKQNVFIYGEAGPMEMKQKNEEVPLGIAFQVKSAPIKPYNVYMPDGLAAYPATGDSNIDFNMTGNAWHGLDMMGAMHINNIILESPDKKLRSEPININLKLKDVMTLALKDDSLTINDIEMNMNNHIFGLEGKIFNVRALPKYDLNFSSDKIDLNEMLAIYPFVKEDIPKGFTFGGHSAINFNLTGSLANNHAKGKLDLTNFSFDFGKLLAKKTGSIFNIDFEATILATGLEVASGHMVYEKGFISDYNILTEKLASILDSEKKLQLNSLIKKYSAMPLEFDYLESDAVYKNDLITFTSLSISNMRHRDNPSLDTILSGTVNAITEEINLHGHFLFSEEASREITSISSASKRFLTADQRINLPIKLIGQLDDPTLTIDKTTKNLSAQLHKGDH